MAFGKGLALLFIGLKLTGHINWSWWLVLLPIIITLIFLVIEAIIEKQEKIK